MNVLLKFDKQLLLTFIYYYTVVHTLLKSVILLECASGWCEKITHICVRYN